MDVSLTDNGVAQSIAAGRWFKFQPVKPTLIVASPYLRTTESARLIADYAKISEITTLTDERIRERELGLFDRLTKRGAMERFPEECAARERNGKFYYRPPGGESWCDVALRVRHFWRDICLHHAGERVLIVTHEVVIRVFRYVVENLNEQEILAIDKASDIDNGGISLYQFDHEGNKLELRLDNYLP
jgi:broad specificity phosphatase PhoE